MSDSQRPPAAAPRSAPPEAGDTDRAAEPAPDEATPTGAIVITTLLAVIILVFWFGMYALNLMRS